MVIINRRNGLKVKEGLIHRIFNKSVIAKHKNPYKSVILGKVGLRANKAAGQRPLSKEGLFGMKQDAAIYA